MQTVRFDYVQEVTGEATTEQHNSAPVDIGCGTFFHTETTPPHRWTVNRSEVMANFPSSPGLKRWVRLGFGRGAEDVLIHWRPEAIWWEYLGFTPAIPGIPGFHFVSSVTVNPCGRSATLEATQISGAITVRLTFVMAIEGSLLRCPETLAMGARGCGCKGKAHPETTAT